MCKCLKRCPHCGRSLDSLKENEAEVLEQIKQRQLEAHPEVAEDDPQDGCENLTPLLRRTHELRGDEGAESGEEMGKPSNR